MIKYRDHTGSLAESMKTMQMMNSVDDIKLHLNKFYTQFGKIVIEIKFSHVGMDKRTGWNTYNVLQRFEGETEFFVAGMSDGCFETIKKFA